MKKVVPMNKRSKKEQKAYNALNRVATGFNTGARLMKTEKHPSRAKQKADFRREII